ncbi:MAG TPA: protein kinase [Terriglobia bacterium]|nr:protein kinase [Terriglobia bacterium]
MSEAKTIGHYEITGKLGEGGMGVVYKAWDQKLRRHVALKFLPPRQTDSVGQAARLRQEAHAISALNHPNIATIYDIDEVEGQFFLTLEFLPGGTLQSYIDQLKAGGKTIKLEQGIEYAVQIADALSHAHGHGVIHRDVKTGNVLLTESGSIKITDFGLAKLLAHESTITEPGKMIGTPATMSPEQAEGLEADARSDIFSAGVVIFEMFTGDLPFKGDTPAALLYQVVHKAPPPISQFRTDIPVALEQILRKALEKKPADRYQNAGELAADLRVLQKEILITGSATRRLLDTVPVRPVTSAEIPVRPHRIAKKLTIPAIVVIILLVLWSGWIIFRNQSGGRPLPAEKRLAVLPFRNIGATAGSQAFADGLTEVVISKLTRMEKVGGSLVVVVSPEEVRVKEIGAAADAWKRLGANLVITGSVINDGQQSQLVVNVEDPLRQEVLRSETIDISNSNIMSEADKVVRLLDLENNSRDREELHADDSSNPAAVKFYIEGRGYLRQSDRVERLELGSRALRDSVAKDPSYSVAYAALAEALLRIYDFKKDPTLLDEAVGHSARALQLNDHLAAAHITMGQVRRIQGQVEAAEQELQAALALEPTNAHAYRALGSLREFLKMNDAAEANYKKAVEIRPGDASGHIELGSFYFRQGKLADAERSQRNAIQLAPDSYLAHNNLGGIYYTQERYAEAAQEFEKSVSIAPNQRAYSNLGTSYYYLKQYADAALMYQRIVRDIAPNNSTYWGNLGDAYRWDSSLHDKAPQAFQRAIDLIAKEIAASPRDATLHARLAQYRAALKDRASAFAEIGNALRLDPSSKYVHWCAALVFEQFGERDQALSHLKKAIDGGYPINQIRAAPPLEQLRKDPRFIRMISP